MTIASLISLFRERIEEERRAFIFQKRAFGKTDGGGGKVGKGQAERLFCSAEGKNGSIFKTMAFSPQLYNLRRSYGAIMREEERGNTLESGRIRNKRDGHKSSSLSSLSSHQLDRP